MEINQYEQILIKCDYISAVCDQLLNQLENTSLSKLYFKNKIIQNTQFNSISTNSTLIQNQYKKYKQQANKQYHQQISSLQQQIKQNQQLSRKLKLQITQLQQSRYEGVKNTRVATKRIKQAASLQMQSLQIRKLLNFELHNLNTLQTSGIEVRQAIQAYQKKQIQLKNKIAKLMDKQKEYFKCRQMQDQYQSLVLNKRKLVDDNILYDQKKHEDIFNKISAIAQSNENLDEMQRYEKQLKCLIKEQIFIIDQIQSRQIALTPKLKQIQIEQDDDNEVFEQQITNLRKTIANRKFQQRAKNIQYHSNKLQAFLNNPTPKNSIHYKNNDKKQNKEQYKSIFKIQIQPVSHNINQKSHNKQQQLRAKTDYHRNSLPTKINKQVSNLKSPSSQIARFKNQYNSENKIPDLDTLQIATIQNILKQKQQQIKQVYQTPKLQQIPENNLKQKQNNKKLLKNPGIKKMIHTQPVQINNKQFINNNKNNKRDYQIGPNSRFIQQIIQQNSSDHLQRLKNNVRIRTKKTQTQKLHNLQLKSNIHKSLKQKQKQKQKEKNNEKQKNKEKSSHSQEKINSSKTLSPLMSSSIKNISTKYTQKKQDSSNQNQSSYDNQFMNLDTRQNKSDQKHHKLKYKDQIHSLTHQKGNLQKVFEKIDILQKSKVQHIGQKSFQDKQHHHQKNSDKEKVKIFKLSNKRKYGNSVSFQRKGKAQGIQQSESDIEFQLPKIQEQEESIRNTLQSNAQKQNLN